MPQKAANERTNYNRPVLQSLPSYESTHADLEVAKRLEALSGMDGDQLRQEWKRLYRTNPPKRMKHDLLVLAVAWKIQEKAYGGLSLASKRKLVELGDELRATGSLTDSKAIRLKPGAKIIREWNNDTHEVLVREDGFEWNGKAYGSLSKVAQEITGAHWSGPRFFGLKPKPKPFAIEGDASL